MALAWPARRSHKPALQGFELCRDETHLGEHLTRAPRPEPERVGQLRGEHHDRLGAHGAVLGRPNDSTSTPRRQVTSAGRQPSAAMALAKRAPSMCTRMPYARATPMSSSSSSSRYTVPRSVACVRLSAAGWTRPECPIPARSRAARSASGRSRPCSSERHDLGAAGVELPCPALAVVHMTDIGAVDRAVRRRDQRQRERVGRSPGRHRLHETAGLEQLGEDVLETRGDRVGAVRRRGAGIRRRSPRGSQARCRRRCRCAD